MTTTGTAILAPMEDPQPVENGADVATAILITLVMLVLAVRLIRPRRS